MKNCNNSSSCSVQSLSTTAYALSVCLTNQLSVDELNTLGVFLTALADLLLLNAEQKQLCENIKA